MNKTYQISIPKDNQGMIGRECPECKKYFKLKLGTGLPTSDCHCPYCNYKGTSSDFHTKEQIEYAKSIAIKGALQDTADTITDMFKDLERKTRGGLIQFKVNSSNNFSYYPIKFYNEKELETYITCDNCKLEFAIYGVFANCPDCNKLNAFTIFNKSLEVSRKMLDLIKNIDTDEDLKEAQLKLILSDCIAAFDGLGKALKISYPQVFPNSPKNLFQNISELNNVLKEKLNLDLSELFKDFPFIYKMFQVRHIYEHNMGVIDDEFIKRIPELSHLKGRKYKIDEKEVICFVDCLYNISNSIHEKLNDISEWKY
jgi:hypothetical protein